MNIISPCPSATITASTAPSTQTYYITDTGLPIAIAAFTSSQSVAICGSMSYTGYQFMGGNTYTSLDPSIFVLTTNSD